MHGMARNVLFAHVFGHFGFGREVSVRKRIAGQNDHLFPRGFDSPSGHFSKFHHDFLHDFHGVVGRGAIAGNDHQRFVPIRVEQVAGRDRAVINTKIRVFHHLHGKAGGFGFVMDGFGEVNIHVHVVMVAEEVREDGVDGKALKMRQAKEVGSDIGLPVG